MEYTNVHSSDLHISRIALGTWAIGGSNWGQYDEDHAINAVKTAIEYGINLIDTAPAYGDGHAEELIGNIIKGLRHNVIIATKCGIEISNNYRLNLTPKFIEEEVDNSLRRLKTDYIDIYQCHWPDKATPIADTMGKMLELCEQGKIRYIGVSNYSDRGIREALQYAPLLTVQPHYSLLDRNIETEIQKTCLANKIAIFPYGSLGAGMLTGKYKEWPRFEKGDARTFFYRFFKKKYWTKIRSLIDALEQIASQKACRPSNVALAWLLAQAGVMSAIVGAKSPSQVLENIGTAEVRLSEEEINSLNTISMTVYQ